MFADDQFVSDVEKTFDTIERLIREKLVLAKMLSQCGVQDVDGRLKEALERPDIRAVADDHLADIRALKLRMLRYLKGGERDGKVPPRTEKPN